MWHRNNCFCISLVAFQSGFSPKPSAPGINKREQTTWGELPTNCWWATPLAITWRSFYWTLQCNYLLMARLVYALSGYAQTPGFDIRLKRPILWFVSRNVAVSDGLIGIWYHRLAFAWYAPFFGHQYQRRNSITTHPWRLLHLFTNVDSLTWVIFLMSTHRGLWMREHAYPVLVASFATETTIISVGWWQDS